MHIMQSRRDFLATISGAGAVGLIDGPRVLADEGPLETTTIHLRQSTVICFAPLYVLEALLRAEGFTDIKYLPVKAGTSVQRVERGDLHFDAFFVGGLLRSLDAGSQIITLGGLHIGCFELFAREPIRTVGDLKGRRVGVQRLNSGVHVYLSIMANHVGLDPNDIDWVVSPEGSRALDSFAAGETDAFLGMPPDPQELRARGVTRVILNTTRDKPWSQYFCCMLYGSRAWVRDHPIATKRFIRAAFKAADFCQAEPASAARQLFDGGFAKHYDYGLQTVEEIPYQRWRDYDSEDTMRFYGLRLHEAGMIQSSPNTLVAEGTDWRFLNEVKRELKA